jgi:alanine or glycine:cation symporter, AGCS family
MLNIKKNVFLTSFLAFILCIFSSYASEEKQELNLLQKFNKTAEDILFKDISFGKIQIDEVDREGNPVYDENKVQKKKVVKIPFLIVFLFLGAVFFTFWYGFINIKLFRHALDVVRGKYDNPNDHGEISHFKALTSALSATVGLGNIAGVAIAIYSGGPGAVVWMSIFAIFGMSAKYSSCTLAQLYRKQNPDGSISGGPMYYLDIGLKQKKLAIPGKILGVLFAFMVMGAALGGGNMFQANQTFAAIQYSFLGGKEAIKEKMVEENKLADIASQTSDKEKADEAKLKADQLAEREKTSRYTYGIVMAILVSIVTIGGVKRVGAATSKIVPLMCLIYVIGSLFVIFTNITQVPAAIGLIFSMAFTQNAFFGGFLGVIIMGVQRAGFSNEAGLGSASIAHAAAKTDEPAREGVVAMLGPVIDTLLICNMTAIVVVVTGQWENTDLVNQNSSGLQTGAMLTLASFESVISWFPAVLTSCILLFAFSTMISWCYYGERGWIYLLDHIGEGLGIKSVIVFRLIFAVFIVVGAVNPLKDVLTFSDIMILGMAFPNILGSLFLANIVKEKTKDYLTRYRAGSMKTYN